jgi:hypothetical protein
MVAILQRTPECNDSFSVTPAEPVREPGGYVPSVLLFFSKQLPLVNFDVILALVSQTQQGVAASPM